MIHPRHRYLLNRRKVRSSPQRPVSTVRRSAILRDEDYSRLGEIFPQSCCRLGPRSCLVYTFHTTVIVRPATYVVRMRFDQSHKWYILVLFPPCDSRPATRYQVGATKKDAMAKGQNAHQNGSAGDKYGTFFQICRCPHKHTEWRNDRNGDPAINPNEPKRSEEQIANCRFWG